MVPDPQLVWNGVYGNLFLFQFAFGSSFMNMHNLQLKIQIELLSSKTLLTKYISDQGSKRFLTCWRDIS